MFDIGFWEISLILVLALVVIGPERLPSAARQVGLFIGKARRYIEGVRTEFESEIDVGEFKRMLHNQEVQINQLQSQIQSSVDNVATDIKDTNLTDEANESNNDTDSEAKPTEEASDTSQQKSANNKKS